MELILTSAAPLGLPCNFNQDLFRIFCLHAFGSSSILQNTETPITNLPIVQMKPCRVILNPVSYNFQGSGDEFYFVGVVGLWLAAPVTSYRIFLVCLLSVGSCTQICLKL